MVGMDTATTCRLFFSDLLNHFDLGPKNYSLIPLISHVYLILDQLVLCQLQGLLAVPVVHQTLEDHLVLVLGGSEAEYHVLNEVDLVEFPEHVGHLTLLAVQSILVKFQLVLLAQRVHKQQ